MRYAKRVFVSLIFLADSYNRQSAPSLFPTGSTSSSKLKNQDGTNSAIQMCLTKTSPIKRGAQHDNAKDMIAPQGQNFHNGCTIMTTYR